MGSTWNVTTLLPQVNAYKLSLPEKKLNALSIFTLF